MHRFVILGVLLANPAVSGEPKKTKKPTSLTIEVTNSEAQPVPTTLIMFEREQELHRVNKLTGTWEGEALYLPDGTDWVFAKGVSVNLLVTAPGYAVTRQTIELTKKRKNQAAVVIRPLDLSTVPGVKATDAPKPEGPDPDAEGALAECLRLIAAGDGPGAYKWARQALTDIQSMESEARQAQVTHDAKAARAVATALMWKEAEQTLIDTPSNEHQLAVLTHRRNLRTFVLDWKQAAKTLGTPQALIGQLCEATMKDLDQCQD